MFPSLSSFSLSKNQSINQSINHLWEMGGPTVHSRNSGDKLGWDPPSRWGGVLVISDPSPASLHIATPEMGVGGGDSPCEQAKACTLGLVSPPHPSLTPDPHPKCPFAKEPSPYRKCLQLQYVLLELIDRLARDRPGKWDAVNAC